MSQHRRHSLLEACASTASGFVLSMVISRLFFLAIDAQVTGQQNLTLVGILTVVSVIRSYFWRRVFNVRS